MSTETAKSNKPFDEVTDGRLKFTIWKRESEKGPWYQGTINNRYKDKTTGEWKDSDSFNEDDWLALAQLAEEAYARVKAQKRADAKARKEKEAAPAAA
jgi:hypothetical protein